MNEEQRRRRQLAAIGEYRQKMARENELWDDQPQPEFDAVVAEAADLFYRMDDEQRGLIYRESYES